MKRLPWVGSYVLCVLMFAVSVAAADWNGPATELGKKIASATGPGTIALLVTNTSSLSQEEVAEIQKSLETQLRSSGIRPVATASATTQVRVTLSENFQALVWVAEITQGTRTDVAMVTTPKTQGGGGFKSGPSVTVRRALLWSQPTQILDALVLDSASPNARLVILDPEAITSYTIAGDSWKREQAWPISRGHVFPRDVRGLLVPNQTRGVDAYLPGTVCTVSTTPSNSVVCHDGDDAWRIGPRAAFFNSGRNYFTGALVPASDKAISPFYSAAWMVRQSYTLSIMTGLDGRVRLTDGMSEQLLSPAITSDWGSDIAAVKSSCGSGMQLLVTSNGDYTQADSLRAFDIPNREPMQVSAPQEFAGPITAIWTHDPNSAIAVSHNLRTGQYEAYSVSILCNP